MKDQDKKYYDIVKYHTDRKYYGLWTPAGLHDAFKSVHTAKTSYNEKFRFHVGLVTVKDICDTLWTEMSYNPLRFGEKNPFVYSKQYAIDKFCDTYYATPETDTTSLVFKDIANWLIKFDKLICKYDPNYGNSKCMRGDSIIVSKNDRGTANDCYKMLSFLVASIHKVCSQNMHDFTSSKSHREAMKTVISTRHPDLVRPLKIPYYPGIEYLNKEESKIWDEEGKAIDEWHVMQAKKQTLMELEEPGETREIDYDIYNQEKLLEKFQQKRKEITAKREWCYYLTK